MADLSGERWLTTAQAAAELGVSKVTALSYGKTGQLERHRRGRGFVFGREAVLALRDAAREREARWISLAQAVELTALTEFRIKQGVASGEIRKVAAARNRPTLERESVLRYAAKLAASPPPPRSPRPKRPEQPGVWLSTDDAAALLRVTRQRVGQLAREGRLPGTRRGRFWWFSPDDVDFYREAERQHDAAG